MQMQKILNIFKNHKRLIYVLLITYSLQFLVGIFLFFLISIHQVWDKLNQKSERILTNVRYTDEKWDLTLYNADPQLLSTEPLYFIAIDGFVLDRRSPIRGFLDTSDFKRLLAFTEPQHFRSISGQLRRLYTKPLIDQGNPVAAVTVSYFEPTDEKLDQIDHSLRSIADNILANISYINGTIDTTRLDVREIPYDYSFAIVDSYNSIVLKTANVSSVDRIPNFIDPSYIKAIKDGPSTRIIRDDQTKELFLIKTARYQKVSELVAIVAIGQSIEPILATLKQYFIFEGIFSIVTVLIVIFILCRTKKTSLNPSSLPHEINFSATSGILMVDEISIRIPYATNQFYLLQKLFSNPSKRYETDQLLIQIGEFSASEKSRKIYDAMISVNKKVSKVIPIKLIMNQNKTYQLNHEILIKK